MDSLRKAIGRRDLFTRDGVKVDSEVLFITTFRPAAQRTCHLPKGSRRSLVLSVAPTFPCAPEGGSGLPLGCVYSLEGVQTGHAP